MIMIMNMIMIMIMIIFIIIIIIIISSSSSIVYHVCEYVSCVSVFVCFSQAWYEYGAQHQPSYARDAHTQMTWHD